MSLDIQTLERTALCVAACDGIDTADLKAGSVNIIEKLRKRYPARYQHDLAAFRADKQLEIQG